uniref:RNA polymerase alpha subunit n=1 Tax=Gahnia tristis TaxID=388572 RepID=UPI001F13E3C1|nr:RNA polymerase alpha subunit [Gahnia tristis]ULQ66046.1 RNA polymerase alpha subunit [Gahnia tristis]
MVKKEIKEFTQTIQWKCVESRIDSKCLNYGRFILSPLKKGQADTIGIAMRRALLGEIKGTSITHAKFEKVKVSHEYSRVVGIEEPVYEILLNLKKVVLRSFTNQIIKAWICVKGPICVTAKDINLPPGVEIIDTTQYIATLTEPIDLSIELKIERDRGYSVKYTNNSQDEDGSYPIDAVFMPVRTVNYTIHNRRNGDEDEEILFLEIWTDGSLSPREALRDASMNLIGLFITAFIHPEEEDEEDIHLKEKENTFTLESLDLSSYSEKEIKLLKYIEKRSEQRVELLREKGKSLEIPWEGLFIDQCGLSSRTYNLLKKANINTLGDFVDPNKEEDIARIQFNEEDRLELFTLLARIHDSCIYLLKMSIL